MTLSSVTLAVDDEAIVAAAACANPSAASPQPFRMLAVTKGQGPLTPKSPVGLMGEWTKARIQLCGRFVVDIDGTRIEDALPGRRGRALCAYLVLNRSRQLPRDELLMAGWGQDAPAEAGNALSVLLSKLRHGLGTNHLRGRTAIELLLPRRPSWMSRRPWRVPTGPSPRSLRVAGSRRGVRPGSPTTSPPGRSWSGWRRPGSRSGAAGWRRSGCVGWSALPPPASALTARRWPRPRNGPGC